MILIITIFYIFFLQFINKLHKVETHKIVNTRCRHIPRQNPHSFQQYSLRLFTLDLDQTFSPHQVSIQKIDLFPTTSTIQQLAVAHGFQQQSNLGEFTLPIQSSKQRETITKISIFLDFLDSPKLAFTSASRQHTFPTSYFALLPDKHVFALLLRRERMINDDPNEFEFLPFIGFLWVRMGPQDNMMWRFHNSYLTQY